ncbi:hypothetical protein Pcinc_010993 [Petrolisthes cinctipes]|uniref:Uncharacterized protein n=1 Tax=Petrolisthes cinctipes TaxID=88211 RepID=A0AAE1KTW9_PETCI|nr:hypothetical protein Pcinc_010993 [Petrolisthes cinctipes]
MLFATYNHWMVGDKFERQAPSLVFFFMLSCRLIVEYQIQRKEKMDKLDKLTSKKNASPSSSSSTTNDNSTPSSSTTTSSSSPPQQGQEGPLVEPQVQMSTTTTITTTHELQKRTLPLLPHRLTIQ